MKIIFLFGAGASLPAKIPDIKTMTSNYYTDYVKKNQYSEEEIKTICILKGIIENQFEERKDLIFYVTYKKSRR